MIARCHKENDKGFSLIELIVVMALIGLVLAISTGNFTTLLRAMKIEAKSAETEMEKIVGLELLRHDIENAGYGLPWFVDTGNWSGLNVNDAYAEADSDKKCGTDIKNYNDGPNNAPRGIWSEDSACSDGSDYLVIKSTIVRNNRESQKWTYIWNDNGTIKKNTWADSNANPDNQTQVIAINPKQNKQDSVLVTYESGGARRYFATYQNATNFDPKPSEVYLLFATGDDNSLRMPFDRADYYIAKSNVPARCAQGTGVLTKVMVRHSDGKSSDPSPLLDCVADMQVVFGVDITNDTGKPDGKIDCYTNDLSSVSAIGNNAENIRNRVREVRVYILSHEGQMDRGFKFGSNTIRVGDSSNLPGCNSSGVDKVLGRDYDLKNITDYQFYRWKVYTLIVPPENLRGTIR